MPERMREAIVAWVVMEWVLVRVYRGALLYLR
jgi:hypothetical protein